jgi:acetylornithine/N-succinyldiaminopimelate aminotransferase
MSLMPTYNRVPLSFAKGEGAYLYAADGRRFLDFGSGIAVTALGHGHPHLLDVMKGALEKPWHLSNIFEIPDQARLAERLVQNSFADLAFFCNSGAEAIEACIKAMRKYHYENGQGDRFRLITVSGAFHGRTLATIAAGGQEKYLKGFGPKVDGFDQVAFGNLNELRAAITPATGGILVEPIQGEGGVRPMDAEYLRALRTVCDEFGLLLVFDEIQSGMGRTGKLFAHEWAGVTPDLMALAKGLGGGFPIGACLATASAAKGMVAGVHGTTFGGNPLAMAAGNAVLDVMLAPGFLANVQAVGAHLKAGIEAVISRHQGVLEEVRGLGLMLGLKPKVPNTDFQNRLRDNGLLAVTAGDNVVRLLPPLILTMAEADEAVAIIEATAKSWE